MKNYKKILEKYKFMIILIIVYALLTIILTILYNYVPLISNFSLYGKDSFYESIITGMHNSFIDFIILTVILNIFLDKSKEKSIIKDYKDKIDDCRFWNSEEAAFKIRALINRLQELKVYELDLSKCFMESIKLKKIKLENSKIMGGILNGANLENASFNNCDLQGAFLKNCKLRTAQFKNCKLRHIKCNGADMRSIIALNCDFESGDFTDANLRDAIMTGNMNKAKFKNCNLERANLLQCDNLNPIELIKCKSLKHTKLKSTVLEEVRRLKSELL